MKNFKNTLIALAIAAIAGLCSSTNAFGNNLWADVTAMKNNKQSISEAQMAQLANKAMLILEQSGQPLFNVDGLNPKFLLDLPREKMTQNEKDMLADAIMENNMFSAELQNFTKNMSKSDAGRYAMDIMQQIPIMIDSKPKTITFAKSAYQR